MPLGERAGHAIHYDVLGDSSAPPLLLIMGLALSSRAWDTLPRRLAEFFRVIVFDNRGTGRSGRKGWIYRMPGLADDAAAVLDATGVAKADVFGISLGGMIAQELALRHTERVRRLALGATFGSFWRSAKATPGVFCRALAASVGHRATVAERAARLLLSETFHAANPTRGRDWLLAGDLGGFRCAVAQTAAVLRHATTRRLAQIRAPTLVLTGDADRLVPPRNSEVLARAIPGAKLLVLPGAGHAFPLEREEETVRALAGHFLDASGVAAT
jgi:3-oxoadipate enol-lactonase